MSLLETEVARVVKSYKPSTAIFTVSKSYYGDIQFVKKNRPSTDLTDPLASLLRGKWNVVESVNRNTGMNEILVDQSIRDISNSLRWELLRHFTSFIKRHNDTKNNKLTILYRWYSMLGQSTIQSRPELEKDLFSIYMWVISVEDHRSDKEETKNAIKLLDVIRQRYEAQGLKI